MTYVASKKKYTEKNCAPEMMFLMILSLNAFFNFFMNQ